MKLLLLKSKKKSIRFQKFYLIESSSEPSDAVRVVNAVLTQLDQLKSYPNVLVIATSNVTGRIDLAFVDRADMKVHIGKGFLTIGYKRTWEGLMKSYL